MDDGVVRPTPAVKRALLETKAALEAAGHTVIEWTPYKPEVGGALLMRFLMGDGGFKLASQVVGGEIPEPWPEALQAFDQLTAMYKDKPPTVGGLWDLQTERHAYLRKLLASWYDTKEVTGTGRPVDGVISAVTPFPSPPRYSFKHVGYTALWNLADQTSCAFPAGFATKNDVKEGEITYRNDDEKDIWEKYDADRVDGMPVGLQVIVPRHEEERALKLAGIAYDALKAYRK
jgi:amidase